MNATKEHRSSSSPRSRKPFFKRSSSHEAFFNPHTIQPKLTIGQPGDPYEREADAMADEVVQKSLANKAEPAVQPKCSTCQGEEDNAVLPKLQRMNKEEEDEIATPKLQRMGEEGEEEVQMKSQTDHPEGFVDEEEMMYNQPTQLKSSGGPAVASDELSDQITQHKGSGQPLEKETRGEMESAFGADFGNVRVHTGAASVQMNQDLNAQAFTHGSDVHFNSGKYDPGSTEGKRLLAHELTHVVQQGGSK